MSEKYDGWCMKAFGLVLPRSFRCTRIEVVKWWNTMCDIEEYPFHAWRNWRKRGTHKIVKVRIVEVADE